MAKYKYDDKEVEAITFDEFKDHLPDYVERMQPKSNGDTCYSINIGDGRTYFSRDEMLVFTDKKVIVFPKSEFDSTFTKI